MAASPVDPPGPEDQEDGPGYFDDAGPPSDDLVDAFRSAFGGWPRVEQDPNAIVRPDWQEAADWSAVPDDEILNTIRELSVPVVEQRLQRLWGAIGRVIVADSTLSSIHAEVQVESFHNGVPSQSAHLRPNGQSRILINDGVADFTRHVTLTFLSWLEDQSNAAKGPAESSPLEARDEQSTDEGTEYLNWASASPVTRRVLAFECLSIAFGELWQPFNLTGPDQARAMAELSAEWAVLFWMAHEFAHAVRARVAAGESVTLLGEDISHLMDRSEPSMEELLCDSFAYLVASAAAESLDYWIDAAGHAIYFNLTFLAQSLVENWQFIRHARSSTAFVGRWFTLNSIVETFEPSIGESVHATTVAFFREFAHGSNVEWATGRLLEMIESTPFAEVTQSQRRADALLEIEQHDRIVRLYLAPTSAVAHATVWARAMSVGIVTEGMILDAVARWEVPDYNETFLSRDFYLAVEAFRSKLLERLNLLNDDERDALVNPAGNVTFVKWVASWPPMQDPIVARVMHEISSDRYPIVANRTVDEEKPQPPKSRHQPG